MDLVLHKKLLALQQENLMLKEEIQKLQELSDKTYLEYMKRAALDTQVLGNIQGRDMAHAITARAKKDDHTADLASAASDRAGRKALRRRQGIERAGRLLAGKIPGAKGEIVKQLRDRSKGGVHQTLHRHGDKHYIVSSNQDETLIFPSDDEHGSTSSYTEVGSGNAPRWDDEKFDANKHHTDTFKQFTASEKNLGR
jgi:hypothetical protein